MDEAKILFISPVLNEQSNILKLIESLRKQSSINWKLIVVDNASEDETKKVVELVAKEDPKILILPMKNREDLVQKSWMRAIKAALESHPEKYLQIIPGDDSLDNETYVAEMLLKLESSDSLGALPSFRYSSEILEFKRFSRLAFYRQWFHVHLIFGVYRRDYFMQALTKFEKINKFGKDFDWWLAFFLYSNRLIINSKAIMFRDSLDITEESEAHSVNPWAILRTFCQGVNQNFARMIRPGKGFRMVNRADLFYGFIAVTALDFFNILKLSAKSLIVR